jgi:hypothetical protein
VADLAIILLMVIGGALTILLRLSILSLSTWLVLLMALLMTLLVHTSSSSFILMFFGREIDEEINLATSLLMVIGGGLTHFLRTTILSIST